jgi:hypothetical protein
MREKTATTQMPLEGLHLLPRLNSGIVFVDN